MTDIALDWDSILFEGSMSLKQGDLNSDADKELASAVIVSIFTWARAEGQNGWWGDSYPDVPNDKIGSKIWLFFREKLTQDTINRIRDAMIASLQWLIEDQVASRYDVVLEKRGIDGLSVLVTVYRLDGELVPLRFDTQWEALANA